MKTKFTPSLLLLLLLATPMLAQTTAFNYQGRLNEAGLRANGNYDFQFTIFDALNGGISVGSQQNLNVMVIDGAFSVSLDFGAGAFPGSARFLEIAVRKPGGNFTTLNPRQPILSTPYSIKSLSATNADNAAKLGGVDSSLFVQKDANGNVNIAGNFSVAGTFSVNTVNAELQYNLGGNRILSANNLSLSLGNNTGNQVAGGFSTIIGQSAGSNNVGLSNTFMGTLAGTANTSGGSNSFFGAASGASNLVGNGNSFFGHIAGAKSTVSNNSFFGAFSGQENTTGFDNAFFGQGAGQANTTGFQNSFFGKSSGLRNTLGSDNAFFGINAGINNTTGSGNTFAGSAAGTGNQTGDNNSFFGRLTGLKNTVSNNSFFGAASGQENTTGTSNSFFGAGAGLSNTTGSQNSFFGLSGGGSNTAGGSNSFFGFDAGLSNTEASENSFFGASAGFSTTTGGANTFVGYQAGLFNQVGFFNTVVGRAAGLNNKASFNAFFGAGAGEQNTTGTNNTFVGTSSGGANVTGNDNSFFGRDAGRNNAFSGNSFFGSESGLANTTGGLNAFFGLRTGKANTVGESNTFIGAESGIENTIGSSNSFVGYRSGFKNSTGVGNTFFGSNAGQANFTSNLNTLIGFQADLAADNLVNATAIGANAKVSQSNSVVLGAVQDLSKGILASNVGIGTSTPPFRLTVQTATGDYGFIHKDSTTTVGSYVGSSASGASGGWFGTLSNHQLHFFVNGGQPSLTIDTTGNVGIGTFAPGSKLTVAGLIQTTSGGVKFPDGTIQTTAATGANAILNQTTPQVGANFNIGGNGTVGGNLTVGGTLNANGANLTNLNANNITTGTLNNAQLGLIPTANIADNAVTAPKIAGGQVVKSLNGLTDTLTLAAGANVTITPAGNTLTIAATGGGGGLTLPFAVTQSDPSTLFGVTNSGTGGAGSFAINNAANSNAALSASTNGTGPAITATGAINTSTQYNVGGFRVLSAPGLGSLWIGKGAGGTLPTPGNANDGNTFVGISAGAINTGQSNAFLGTSAGSSNNFGSQNTFIGYLSGASNNDGNNNTFVGANSNLNTTGSNNTFIGISAGVSNATGSNNTALGAGANVAANNLTNATVIGAGAVVSASNTVVLGRANGADTVRIPGDLVVTGTFSNPSDARLKTEVTNLRYGLNEVMRLRPVTWKWNDRIGGKTQLGLIAQEVQPLLPELVAQGTDTERMLSLNYLGLMPVLIKAIQDQQATITSLRSALEAQRGTHNEVNVPAGSVTDVRNTYNGNVFTDEEGKATVILPVSVEESNRDFRYQLTVIGQFAQAIIAEELKNHRFTIKTSVPRVKVSWEVIGIRKGNDGDKN